MTDRLWSQAWREALYGPAGFFLTSAPAEHFSTSVTASPLYAGAVRRLAGLVDDALDRPDPFDVVDLGAGRAELLHGLPEVPARWRLTAVELAPDPGGALRWQRTVPTVTGVLFANEWLDSLPLDIVENGHRLLVSTAGQERPGPPATAAQLAWCRQWWPAGRAEVGLSRDRAWAAAMSRVRRGLAVAVDYGHLLADRRPTLTGYRHGRQVSPVPDGSGDLTAHVALDSCAAASNSRLLTQREALLALGVDGRLPAPGGDARRYAAALQSASQAGRLLDPAGLGGFGWLVRDIDMAPVLSPSSARRARLAAW